MRAAVATAQHAVVWYRQQHARANRSGRRHRGRCEGADTGKYFVCQLYKALGACAVCCPNAHIVHRASTEKHPAIGRSLVRLGNDCILRG